VTDVHEGSSLDLHTSPHSDPQNKHRIGTCGKDGILNLWNLDGNNVSSDVSPMEHVTAGQISTHSPTMGFPEIMSMVPRWESFDPWNNRKYDMFDKRSRVRNDINYPFNQK